MLIEELFGRGIMAMGPAKDRPGLQTGTFDMELRKTFPALKAAEMEKMRWIEGEWNSVNRVPATSKNPAYEDVNTGTYRFCEKDSWICLVGKDRRERKYLTFDPFSGQWIYVLLEGAYGILRSRGWNGNEIAFEGEVCVNWRARARRSSSMGVPNSSRAISVSWRTLRLEAASACRPQCRRGEYPGADEGWSNWRLRCAG